MSCLLPSNWRRLFSQALFLALVVGLRSASPVVAEVAPALEVADRFLLAIPKSAFGRDYLFSVSLIPQGQAPTSHGLAGKVVRFELSANNRAWPLVRDLTRTCRENLWQVLEFNSLT